MEIDLLAPRKLQKEIEGALKSVEVDKESGLAFSSFDRLDLEW